MSMKCFARISLLLSSIRDYSHRSNNDKSDKPNKIHVSTLLNHASDSLKYSLVFLLLMSTQAVQAYNYCKSQPAAGDTAWDIEDNGASTISVQLGITAGDVWSNVKRLNSATVTGRHQYTGDLAAELNSPAGTNVILFRLGDSRYGEGASGCSKADFDITFSDFVAGPDLSVLDEGVHCLGTNDRGPEGLPPSQPYSPHLPNVGSSPAIDKTILTYNSQGLTTNKLANFVGEDPLAGGGTWEVFLEDAYAQDVGTLDEACVDMDFGSVTYDIWVSKNMNCTDTVDNETFIAGETVYMCYVASNEATQDFTFQSETNNHSVNLSADLTGTYDDKYTGTTLQRTAYRSFIAGSGPVPVGTSTLTGSIIIEGSDTYFSAGETLTTSESVSITVTANPSWTVVKATSSTPTMAGDTLNYTFTVDNTGDVPISGVTVTDVKCAAVPTLTSGDTDSDGVLDVTEIHVYSCTSIAVLQTEVDAGSVNNNVSVNGTPAGGTLPNTTDSLSTSIVQSPALSIVKTQTSANNPVTILGDIDYEIVITNDGNISLTGVSVSDILPDSNAGTLSTVIESLTSDSILEVGETWTYTVSYAVTQGDIDTGTDLTNTASVVTTVLPTAEDDTAITSITQNDAISLLKVLSSNADQDGSLDVSLNDTLTYTITATNDGTTTLSNVVVSDTKISPSSNTCLSVAPASTCVLSGTYSVTQTDVDAGNIDNTGSVTSTEVPGPIDTPVISTPVAQNNGLSIVKVLDSSGPFVLGDSLTYTVTATNDGTTTLSNVVVSDTKISPSSNTCASVAPAATCVLSGTYSVTQTDVDAGNIDNTGSVTSTEVPGPIDTPVISTPVAQNNGLSIVKVLDSSGPFVLGDSLTYTVTATNDGTTTLSNVVVSDTKITPSSNTCASVAPAATCVLSGTYSVTQTDVDAGNIDNTGSVTSTEVPGPIDTPVISTPVAQNNGLSIVKVLDSSGPFVLGDSLTYTVTATNDGSTTLNNVIVSDTKISPSSNTCASVAPGATCVLSGTYQVTQGDVDAGTIDNTGSVTSTEVPGPTDTPVITTPVPQNDALSIVKVLSGNADEDGSLDVSLNDTLSYTVTASNDGSTTLNNVIVSDTKISPSSNTCASVAPGATCVLSGTYQVTQGDVDAGTIDNTGSVTSTEVPGPTDTPVITTPVPQNDALSIVKVLSGNADEDGSLDVSLNDTLSYTVTASNDGSTTLNNVIVSDTKISPSSNTCASVAPGATCVLSGTYQVTQGDVDAGTIDNTGSVTSTEVPGPTDTPVITTPVPQNDALSIVKVLSGNADEDGSLDVSLNDTLSYTVTASNDGTTTLSNVVVSDTKISPSSNTCLSVAPASTCVLSGTYSVTQTDVDAGNIDNTGSVTSTEVPGPIDTPVISTPVAQNNGLSIVKVLDSSGPFVLGDSLTYTVTATNDGTTTLSNVVVSDTKITPSSNTCASVAPAATCVLSGTYSVTQTDVDAGNIDNTGSVTSTEVPGPIDTPVISIPVAQTDALSIVKVLDSSGPFVLGDSLTYTVTATNDGTTTLSNVVVSDTKISPSSNTCASVAPAATCVLSGTYSVTQTDVDAGNMITRVQ